MRGPPRTLVAHVHLGAADRARNAGRPALPAAPADLGTLRLQFAAIQGRADRCARLGDESGRRRHAARAAQIAREIADARAELARNGEGGR